jgi:hypothetical protein
MANAWSALAKLFDSQPVQMGSVTAHLANGTSIVTTPEGGTVTVDGIDKAIGTRLSFKGRVVLEELPNVPLTTLDV